MTELHALHNTGIHPLNRGTRCAAQAWLSYWLGRQWRRAGQYDARTLTCLRNAWRKQPSLRHLLGYLGVRRDLGYSPSPALLSELNARLPSASGKNLHRALNLLLEGGVDPVQLALADPNALQPKATHTAPVLTGSATQQETIAIPQTVEVHPPPVTTGAKTPRQGTAILPSAAAPSPPARTGSATRHDRTAILQSMAAHSPAVAGALQAAGIALDETGQALARLQNSQSLWRQEFAAYLAERRGSICVVGNAPALADSGLGPYIDAQRCVVRFNRYQSTTAGASPHTRGSGKIPGWTRWFTRGCCHPGAEPFVSQVVTPSTPGTGSRIDVLVCAPDFAGTPPPGASQAEWLILSGCDMRYQLYEWQGLVPLLVAGQKILTLPRAPWRKLVRELRAPPSAGVLLLEWLMELLGEADGITATGFQDAHHPAAATRSCYPALPWLRDGRRHNWPRELALLQRWYAEGLAVLEAS